MNKAEKNKALTPIRRLIKRRIKISIEQRDIHKELAAKLQSLAKKACPYKPGQVIHRSGSRVWFKIKSIDGMSERGGDISAEYADKPYMLYCYRCNRLGGKVDKNKARFIRGYDAERDYEVCDLRPVTGD